MSPTQAVEDTRTISSTTASTEVDVQPRMGEVVKAIRDEAVDAGVPCNRRKASRVYMMLVDAVRDHRRYRHEYAGFAYHLTPDHIDELHDVLDVVMPDDAINPPAGSAHEKLNRRLLRDDEFSLIHTKGGKLVPVFCVVRIEMCSI